MGTIIDGKEVSTQLQAELKEKTDFLRSSGITPKLVVLVVGDQKASQVYVRNTQRVAQKIGIEVIVDYSPKTISEEDLCDKISQYNQMKVVDGIFLQLPLPVHLNQDTIIETIAPEKDVDGVHPLNLGHLLVGRPRLLPCTPYGIMKLLEYYKIPLKAKRAVVLGRSNIVGKPMAQLLLASDATVTIVHSHTQNIKSITQEADILVVAIGKGHFVTEEFVKDGAVVIDVGMNIDEQGNLIGDVDFHQVRKKVSHITPVPGGVGQMTVTMLMSQTIDNAQRRMQK